MSNTFKPARAAFELPAGQTTRIPLGDPELRDRSVLTASVKSDQELSFWWEWGDKLDTAGALPYSSEDLASTCPAGGSQSVVQALAGAPDQAELVLHNAGGALATGFANLSSRSHS
jgi:hypothetical protein